MPGGAAILQIEDTGPGIASTDMDQISSHSSAALAKREGTGLGLSIVKRVVDSLGGEIALENIAGAGRSGSVSRFSCRLSANSTTVDRRQDA